MLLVMTGLSQAALMITGAYMLGLFLSTDSDQARMLFFVAMLLSGIIALLAHAVGRWLAERFGQNYVAICRVRLLKAIVRSGGETSRHGITMTRLITDLSSIKNWVGQGIAGGTAHAAGLFGLVIGAWLISPAAMLAIGTAFFRHRHPNGWCGRAIAAENTRVARYAWRAVCAHRRGGSYCSIYPQSRHARSEKKGSLSIFEPAR